MSMSMSMSMSEIYASDESYVAAPSTSCNSTSVVSHTADIAVVSSGFVSRTDARFTYCCFLSPSHSFVSVYWARGCIERHKLNSKQISDSPICTQLSFFTNKLIL